MNVALSLFKSRIDFSSNDELLFVNMDIGGINARRSAPASAFGKVEAAVDIEFSSFSLEINVSAA